MSANSKGGTNRQHEDALIKMGFIPKRELNEVDPESVYLYDIYKEIRFTRIGNELHDRCDKVPLLVGKSIMHMAVNKPITHRSLIEYQQCMNVDLSATECKIMLQIDAIYNKSIG